MLTVNDYEMLLYLVTEKLWEADNDVARDRLAPIEAKLETFIDSMIKDEEYNRGTL